MNFRIAVTLVFLKKDAFDERNYLSESVIYQDYFVGNKAKGQISKRVFQENKACQIFLKNEHFLPPDTHT